MNAGYAHEPDVEALITALSAEESGKSAPFLDGYHPQHRLLDDQLVSGMHRYYDGDCIPLGKSALGTITFLSPETVPQTLWEGRMIRIQEGDKVVGFAKITRIFNETLRAEPDSPLIEASMEKPKSIPQATDKRVIQFSIFAAGVTDDEALDKAVFEISDKIEEIFQAYPSISKESLSASVERVFDDSNVGICAGCGDWCSDRTKPNAIRIVSNGARVGERWFCDLCLPKDHPNAF